MTVSVPTFQGYDMSLLTVIQYYSWHFKSVEPILWIRVCRQAFMPPRKKWLLREVRMNTCQEHYFYTLHHPKKGAIIL